MGLKKIYLIFSLSIVFCACESDTVKDSLQPVNDSIQEKKQDSTFQRKIGFSNPALLSTGTDVGNTFKVYYLTGSIDKMIELTSTETIKKYGLQNLRRSYLNLDFGFDMKFYNMIQESNSYLLMYKCEIQATKVKKNLKVVVENDSAKIVPFNPLQGQIFQ